MLAGIGGTVVDGVLAVLARVTRFTVATVSVDQVHTGSLVGARSVLAVVDVLVTGRSRPARMADALVVEESVHTGAMLAGFRETEVDLLLAPLARESWWAGTLEVVD